MGFLRQCQPLVVRPCQGVAVSGGIGRREACIPRLSPSFSRHSLRALLRSPSSPIAGWWRPGPLCRRTLQQCGCEVHISPGSLGELWLILAATALLEFTKALPDYQAK